MVDRTMDLTKMWDYRVVRKTSKDGLNECLSVQEVYYDDDGKPMAQTVDLMIEGDTIAGMRKQLQSMLWCLDKEILDELESDVTEKTPEKTPEKRISELEDRLEMLINEISNTKKVRSL